MTRRERDHKLREYRRENKLCGRCGKQDERTLGGMQRCAACAEKARVQNRQYRQMHPSFREQQRLEKIETYAWLRERKLCVRCKTQDAFTLAGRCYCAECAEIDAQRPRNKQARAERKKQKDAERKEKGLCIQCGKPLDRDGVYCRRCVFRINRKRVLKRIDSGINWPRGDNGYCYTCNKRPHLPGKSVCQICYDQELENLSHTYGGKGAAATRPESHPFRKAEREFFEKRKYRGENKP